MPDGVVVQLAGVCSTYGRRLILLWFFFSSLQFFAGVRFSAAPVGRIKGGLMVSRMGVSAESVAALAPERASSTTQNTVFRTDGVGQCSTILARRPTLFCS